LKLQKEVKLQDLAEKNGKILDLNNIRYILSNYEEYQVLTKIIRNLSQNKDLKRILIIGKDLISIYSQLRSNFPTAHFYIASKSKDILKSFEEHFENENKYSTYILDVLNGASLHDLIYTNSPFDLVIVNKIYNKVKKKKRYLSTRFLYKFYLQQYGALCLVNYLKDSKKEKFKLSESVKPTLEKKIPVKQENYLVQFIIYSKNHN
jgi:hypothetical protein